MPPLAKSYLFPPSLMAQPAPHSAEDPSNMVQRMEPASTFFHHGAGGTGGGSNVDMGAYVRRAASDVLPQPQTPYTTLSRPSVSAFADGGGSPFAFGGRNHYGSSAGGGGAAAALPFPIITIPFRSPTGRSPVKAAAPPAATAGIAGPGGLHGQAASASTNSLQSLATGLAWDGPFPTSGKEPTFPMKLYVQ